MIVSLFLVALPWLANGRPESSGWAWNEHGQPPVVSTSSGQVHGKVEPTLPECCTIHWRPIRNSSGWCVEVDYPPPPSPNSCISLAPKRK